VLSVEPSEINIYWILSFGYVNSKVFLIFSSIIDSSLKQGTTIVIPGNSSWILNSALGFILFNKKIKNPYPIYVYMIINVQAQNIAIIVELCKVY
jgi:hypothetical protein